MIVKVFWFVSSIGNVNPLQGEFGDLQDFAVHKLRQFWDIEAPLTFLCRNIKTLVAEKWTFRINNILALCHKVPGFVMSMNLNIHHSKIFPGWKFPLQYSKVHMRKHSCCKNIPVPKCSRLSQCHNVPVMFTEPKGTSAETSTKMKFL